MPFGGYVERSETFVPFGFEIGGGSTLSPWYEKILVGQADVSPLDIPSYATKGKERGCRSASHRDQFDASSVTIALFGASKHAPM